MQAPRHPWGSRLLVRRAVAKSLLFVIVAVVVVLIAGVFVALFQSGGSTTIFQTNLDTLPGGGEQLAMLSYSFQTNGSGGFLFVVVKDYANTQTVISKVQFDNDPVNSSAVRSPGCGVIKPGFQCGITLLFGDNELSVPVLNSAHSLKFLTGSGAVLEFVVTAGTTGEAECVIVSSC